MWQGTTSVVDTRRGRIWAHLCNCTDDIIKEIPLNLSPPTTTSTGGQAAVFSCLVPALLPCFEPVYALLSGQSNFHKP